MEPGACSVEGCNALRVFVQDNGQCVQCNLGDRARREHDETAGDARAPIIRPTARAPTRPSAGTPTRPARSSSRGSATSSSPTRASSSERRQSEARRSRTFNVPRSRLGRCICVHLCVRLVSKWAKKKVDAKQPGRGLKPGPAHPTPTPPPHTHTHTHTRELHAEDPKFVTFVPSRKDEGKRRRDGPTPEEVAKKEAEENKKAEMSAKEVCRVWGVEIHSHQLIATMLARTLPTFSSVNTHV